MSLPQGCIDGVGITGIDRPTGEGRLAGVGSHAGGPFDEEEVGSVRSLSEEKEHGGVASGVG